MDCQMPQIDGYEATRRIKQMPDHIAEIPIVALTAHITVEDRNKCFAAGMVDYMGKPFKGEELKLLLSRWLVDLVAGYGKKAPGTYLVKEKGVTQQIPVDENLKNTMHDLRNYLSIIIGNTELAFIDKKNPEKLETQLNNILHAVNKATEISLSLTYQNSKKH